MYNVHYIVLYRQTFYYKVYYTHSTSLGNYIAMRILASQWLAMGEIYGWPFNEHTEEKKEREKKENVQAEAAQF